MADSPSLRASLAEIDEELAGVHQRMAELQAQLAHLAELRKSILASLQAIFYPVTTLPTEIIAEIFMHYVDTAHIGGVGGPMPYPPWLKGSGNGPLLLASVCRAWREVALGLQPIWSCMKIFTASEYLWATENLLQCWLPRAGSHALDIDITVSDGTNSLVTTLAPYSRQWEAFACGVEGPAVFPAGELIRGRLPLLKRLELAWYPSRAHLDSPLTVFADAPGLRQVYLIYFTVDMVSLPWAQLTDLKLDMQEANDFIPILQLTSNLEKLSVEAYEPLHRVTPIQLLRLHTLKVEGRGADGLLTCLTLPALAHLELADLAQPVWPIITEFLARSAGKLHVLTLHAPDVNAALDLFRAAPSLHTVRVEAAAWRNGAIDLLCAALAHEPDFLPSLSSFVLNQCTTAVELPYANLADMLAARWDGRGNGDDGALQIAKDELAHFARLESFEIVVTPSSDSPSAPDMTEFERGLNTLRSLAADGQKIHIRALHAISDMVDAEGIRPPLHLYT